MSLRYPIPATVLGLTTNPVIAVLTPLTIGSLVGLITKTSVKTWYPTLKKPKGQPPRWAFPVAWTYLYGTMGYASHLIAQSLRTTRFLETAENANLALTLYFGQLALNFLWTPIFFGLKKPGPALIDGLALTTTVIYMTNVTSKFNSKAAYLFLPYCAWVTYANYLNGAIWYLNPGDRPSSKIRDTVDYIVSKFSGSASPKSKDQ
ncbi:hypothetical protein MJO28_000787 [Puccinia striiformis f. sp. tritici]|uniref:TspO/MBR-related protein n=3 Tax=Puccinia striiformis TaxID=27350 RepID=A0A0L0VP11_9BASI|nr:hypothetical protein Pst134EA_000436 [Puccinia striiformis f. sp. tritici]XP_047812833.1 hypothetical protein Pst134EA_000452 [Puccinia striiformis f. sp. tritici]KAI9601318.1 hypothetical protein H4Q26_001134 [Puccinia striiformis f. sp. tritici PST-130]KNF01004.1 hypothetical protein PSTG_05637 [Puccinia striiformis f. sp. tritici PST-78]POW07579.1 hypothetical protein PSTT_08207 [Puccinia striiformis]KAH9466599.1 hypothetical protein Pst134EB_001649 [Puccinia striiformis f. sp. tritici]